MDVEINESSGVAELETKFNDIELGDEAPSAAFEEAHEEGKDAAHPPEIPNGGYGWVVVFGAFWIHVFVLGNVYSFGVFLPVLAKAFNADIGTASWIGSIGFGMLAGVANFTGAWADRFGNSYVAFTGGLIIAVSYVLASLSTEIWHLFITLGLMAGFGYSMSFLAGVSVVSQWFTTRRGLAVGMAVAGAGLGQFAVSLSSGALLTAFGWREALQLLALFNFIGITIASMLIRRLLPCFVHESSSSSLDFFQDRDFALLYAGVFFASLGTNMQFVQIDNYALVLGLPSAQATLLVSFMGIASAVGRVASGYVADYFGKMRIFKLCVVLAAVANFVWIGCTDFGSLAFFAFFFGLFGGGVISLVPSVCSLLFGLQKQGNVMGMMLTATALGNLLSSPIAGFIYDADGVYYPSIIVAGVFILVGIAFILNVRTSEEGKESHPTISESPKVEDIEATDV